MNTRFTAAKFAFSWVPSQNGFVLKWQHQDFMEVGGQTPFCWRPGGAIRKLVRYRAYTRSTLLTSRETIQRGSYLWLSALPVANMTPRQVRLSLSVLRISADLALARRRSMACREIARISATMASSRRPLAIHSW